MDLNPREMTSQTVVGTARAEGYMGIRLPCHVNHQSDCSTG